MENPKSTLMGLVSPMRECIASMLKHKQLVYLGAFGGRTQKPLFIWSTTRRICRLARKQPKHLKESLATTHKGRVTGKREALKESAGYTKQFGQAVAAISLSCLEQPSIEECFVDEAAGIIASFVQ